MTKTIGIISINFYQALLSPFLKTILGTDRMCMFQETCSAYTKRMIEEKGLIQGSALGFVRVLKCQPYFS